MHDPYRATRDVDLLAFGNIDDAAIRALVSEICSFPCHDDGIDFDLTDLVIETIRPEEEYSGKRARFRAMLGKTRIAVHLDIGVGDAVSFQPDEVTYPTLLTSLPAPRIRAYPREQSVAEKFEAMVKLDVVNSRMKDFHDIWALAGMFAFDGLRLQRSVVDCFERRGTAWPETEPGVLTPEFYHHAVLSARWKHYRTSGPVLVHPPDSFEEVGERIMAFLGPLRNAIVEGILFEQRWSIDGMWQPAGGVWR